MKSLNLAFFALMSQQASQTLRASAREAEFYMTRQGQMKTASGVLAITSGILGVFGLILAPFGGIALTTVAMSMGIASVITAVPSAVIDITNDHINQPPDFYARIANNQMQMVQQQGLFISGFLSVAHGVITEEAPQLTETEIEEIEKFMYIYDVYLITDAVKSKDEHIQLKTWIKGFLATQGSITAISRSVELGSLRKGYNYFINALEQPNTINRNKAQKFVGYLFDPDYHEKNWISVLDLEFDFLLDPDEVLEDSLKFRQDIFNDLTKDTAKGQQLAKQRIHEKAIKANSKIPKWARSVAESVFPKSVKSWANAHKSLIKGALFGISAALDTITIGLGIYDVIIGAKNLQGSGTITDRLKEQADLIDTSLLGILTVYEEFTGIPTDQLLVNQSFMHADLLTGIEVHACNQYWGGTTYGMFATIHQNSTSCTTLDLMDFQVIHRGEWQEYNGFVLGQCGQFGVEPSREIPLQLVNLGTDAMCLEHLNLKTNFASAPKFTCKVPDSGVWIASDYNFAWKSKEYTDVYDTNCRVVNGISQLRIVVPDVTRAGTDGSIQIEFYFAKGRKCTTRVLDNKGNDLATNSDNVYHSDILDACSNMVITESDLIEGTNIEVKAVNLGTDGLTIAGLEFYANIYDENRRFRCNVPTYGSRIDYNSTRLNCYQVKESFDARAVYGVQIHANSHVDHLVLKLCSGGKCCMTSAFNNVYAGTSTLYEDVLLRDCDGFIIENNAYSIFTMGGFNLLEAVSIYSTRFKLISPMDTCYSDYFYNCQIPTDYRVSSLRIGVCDTVDAGTDSQISVKICSNGICCSSLLDKSGNDFERGDWMEYANHELSKDCRNFPISTNDVQVMLKNEGSDALCIDKFQVRSDGYLPKILSCYLPLTNAYWVEDGFLEMTCD